MPNGLQVPDMLQVLYEVVILLSPAAFTPRFDRVMMSA